MNASTSASAAAIAFGAMLLTQMVRVRDENKQPQPGVLRPTATLVGMSTLALTTAFALVWGILTVPQLPPLRFGLAVVAGGLVATLAMPALRAQRAALNTQITAAFVQGAVHATLLLTFASLTPRSAAGSPVYTVIADASGVLVLALIGMWGLFGSFRTEVRSLWRAGRPALELRCARGPTTMVAFAVLWSCLYLPGPVCGDGGCASSVQGAALLTTATVAAALLATNIVMSWRRGLERLESAAAARRPRFLRTRA
jgi:hypothetical protein